LEDKSYLRIRFKHILSEYNRQSKFLQRSTDINTWTTTQMILSFIVHLINASRIDESANKKNTTSPKIWEFVDYLRKYFIEESYDGATFINSFDANTDNPTKGFGLKFTKTVCNKYNLKSGPFSKVKKQCNVWSNKLYNQSRGVIAVPKKENEKSSNVPHNYSKFVTDVSMFYQSSKAHKYTNVEEQQEDAMDGMRWYWFNDMDGAIKWTPYRQADQEKLMHAYKGGAQAAMVCNDRYRVEFNRQNAAQPGGNQYVNASSNTGGRTVVCSKPQKEEIHGVPLTQEPM